LSGKHLAYKIVERSSQGGIMKKYLTLFVLLAFMWSSSGCQFQQRYIQTDPFPNTTPNLNMDITTPIIIGAAVLLTIVATALVIGTKNLQKNKRLFQELGSHVPYLMHEEAPATARFLGEVECQECSQIEVKNMLRIKAAQMGGNLLVIDTITESQYKGTSTYSGSGRVYTVKEVPEEIR
jgi:hypothetical protein